MLARNLLNFWAWVFPKKSSLIPQEAIDNFKRIFETEILNDEIAKHFSFEQILKAYKPFARGWANHYGANCPASYKEVEIELNGYLEKYIGKSRVRKNLFDPFSLMLNHPFIKTI